MQAELEGVVSLTDDFCRDRLNRDRLNVEYALSNYLKINWPS